MLKCPSSALFCLLLHSLVVLLSEMLEPLLSNWHLCVEDLWLKDALPTLPHSLSLLFNYKLGRVRHHLSFLVH